MTSYAVYSKTDTNFATQEMEAETTAPALARAKDIALEEEDGALLYEL